MLKSISSFLCLFLWLLNPYDLQARSRLAGVLETAEQSDEEEGDYKLYRDPDVNKLYKGPGFNKDHKTRTSQSERRTHIEPDMNENHTDMKDQDQLRDRRLQRELDFDEDRQDLRGQVRFLKEANKKVLIQNQKLMNEVEKTSFELQASRNKVNIEPQNFGKIV